MAWVTKSVVVIENGKKRLRTRRVWVADPKPAKHSVNQKKGRPNESQAGLVSAQARARRLAQAERRRLAQRRMWDQLHHRANEIRSTLAPSSAGSRPPTPAERVRRVSGPASTARDKADIRARFKPFEDLYRRQALKKAEELALDKAKKTRGTPESGRALERLTFAARDRQRKSGGTDVDTDFINQLDDAYREHVRKVSVQFKSQVDKLKKFYVLDKKGNLVKPKTLEDWKKAQKIIDSPTFKGLQKEYGHLFGEGGHIGSVARWSHARDSIAVQQRKYLYNAAKSTLYKQIDLLKAHGNTKAVEELLKDWNSGGKYLYEAAKDEINPESTSFKWTYNTKTHAMDATRRTVDEEFNARREHYMAMLKLKYNEYVASEQQRLRMQHQEAVQMNTPEVRQNRKDMADLAAASKEVGAPENGPTSPDQLNKVVDKAVKTWDAQNRDKFLSARQRQLLAADGRGALGVRASVEYRKYEAALEATRKRYYKAFGANAPGPLDTVLNFPGVKQSLSALGVGVGAIGTGIRIGAKMTTGNSTFDISLKLESLPGAVQRDYKEWVKAGSGLDNPVGSALGLFSTGSVPFNVVPRGESPIDKFLRSAEGKAWYKKHEQDRLAETSAQDQAFLDGFYGSGDIWSKVDALNAYGSTPFNNDALNFGFNIVGDPTNALPLKATTWLARFAHAKSATEGLGAFKKLTLGVAEWATVTEPELRFEKALAPYLRSLKGGANPATIRELILTKLSGIADGADRAKETQKLFRKYGIDIRVASGHELDSLAQEALLARFAAAGIDYQDVAAQARKMEEKRLSDEALERASKSQRIQVADNLRAKEEARGKQKAEAGRAATTAARTAEASDIAARAARPVVPDITRETSTTLGHQSPRYAQMRAADPLRGPVHPDADPLRGPVRDVDEPVVRSARIGRNSDVVTRHGVQFAPGEYSDEFFASKKYKRLAADLEATMPNGKPNKRVRTNAQVALYEIGRRSIAKRIGELEGAGTRLSRGRLRFHKGAVVGGPRYSDQYLVSASDLLMRSGAHTPTEEAIVAGERSAFNDMTRRFASIKASVEKGHRTLEQGQLEIEAEIRAFQVQRRSADLEADLRAGMGESSAQDVGRDFTTVNDPALGTTIPTGQIFLEDWAAIGTIDRYYYETFSLLPGGAGDVSQTGLMSDIMNPEWRANLTRGQFGALLRGVMFQSAASPVSFRDAGQHLFALFHMTLLDGNLKRLEQYSKSVESLLSTDAGRYNMYARMWKVMESRATDPLTGDALRWADSFLESENAFIEAAIHEGRLHPNLAIAMIPYGPMARRLGVRHGYAERLRGLATTLDKRFPGAPARWTDRHVDRAIEQIGTRTLSVPNGTVRASQVIDYIAQRYGDVFRRARFQQTARRYAMEAAGFTRDDARAFDDLYWGNELTHDNPALHTVTFLMRMQDNDLSRGDTWVRYANSYWKHMAGAGAEEEAQHVLSVVLDREIHRTAGGMNYEGITDYVGGTASTGGNVYNFLRKAGLLPHFDRVAAGDEARKIIDDAEQDILDQQKRDDWGLADAVRRSDDASPRAGFANADFGDTLIGVQREIEQLKAISDETAELSARLPRPSKTVMDAAHRLQRSTAKKLGARDSLRPIQKIDSAAVRQHLSQDLKHEAARKRLFAHLNGLVYRTLNTPALPVGAAEQMEAVVAAIREMPGGQQLLADLADYAGRDLYQSRLIDYLKNEKWYKFESATSDLPPVPPEKLFAELSELEDSLLRAKDPDVRAAIQKKIDALNERVNEMKAARDEAISKRPDTKIPDADPPATGFVKPEGSFADNFFSGPYNRPEFNQHGGPTMFFQIDYGGGLYRGPMSKIHVTATPMNGQRVLDILDPIARKYGVTYKWVKSKTEMVDGADFGKGGIQQGKFVTAYPPPDIAQVFTYELDAALRAAGISGGNLAPSERVLSPGSSITHRWVPDATASGSRFAKDGGYGEPGAVDYIGPDPNKPPDPIAADEIQTPIPSDIQSPRATMAQRALDILGKMTEEEWLAREEARARRAMKNAPNAPARKAARQRIVNVERARRVIAASKNGGSYISKESRSRAYHKAVNAASQRAIDVYNPNRLTTYASSGAGALAEQGRHYWRLFSTAPVQADLGRVPMVDDVSVSYVTHHAAIEAEFDRPISGPLLTKFGFPDGMTQELTATDLLTNSDEFERSLRGNPQFGDFMLFLHNRVETRLKVLTGDMDYTVEQWLSDRLMHRGDFYEIKKFEKDERAVGDAIVEARGGVVRRSYTDLARRQGDRAENPLNEMVDSELRVVIAKTRKLKQLGVDPHMYNEARRVLRAGMVRKNVAMDIVAYSTERASKELYAAGKKVEDADWDKLFREKRDSYFDSRRNVLAADEAQKKLGELAAGDMYGSTVEATIREFEERYTFDQTVRGVEPSAISPFQKKTLGEAVKTRIGVKDLDNIEEVQHGLQAHGQTPPFKNRAAMRDWLTKYGYWTPRTAQAVEAGKKSWSIQEESKYYRDNWAYVPPWANPDLLQEGGDLNHILHDEIQYGEQNRRWGLFNRNMEARYASGTLTREQRARFLVEGNEALGLKGKRDLVTERKYVMDRYGPLVTDDAGNLTAFPWLMHEKELRSYIVSRSGKGIAENLVQSIDELDILMGLIEKHIGKHFDESMMTGKPVTYAEFFTITSNVVHDLLKDPIWLKRDRDAIGKVIKGQAAFRRALVFTQIGFLTTNVIDTLIKGPWTSFITRSFHNGPISIRARSQGLLEFGFNQGTQLLHDVPVHGTERFREADSLGQKLLAITELPAQGAGKAENFTKLRLAQSMYDGAYKRALAKLGDDGLADAAAREFIHDEVSRLWPTVGDGPWEKLFNNLSPFMSYQFKNHMVFIGEIAGHPAIYNWLDKLGDAIEDDNRKRWAKEHPSEVLPPNLARLIEIPWAPGSFIDLGQFSDAQRGLKPLYEVINGQTTVGHFASNFIRLASANDQNMVGGILNAIGYTPTLQWVQGHDAEGFPTGVWTQVEVPWEAPWGGTANLLNSFWPVETGANFIDAMNSGFTPQKVTKLFAQTMFFGGIKQYDRGAGLNSYYYALRDADPRLAQKWLDETPNGADLRTWWTDKANDSHEFYTPQEVKDILDPPKPDPNPWFHSKSPEFQSAVKVGLDELTESGRKWDAVIGSLTPGTKEYRLAKIQAATDRYRIYSENPELYEFEAFSKTPDEWAATLNRWQLDELKTAYYNMKAPEAKDFKSAVEWQKAVRLWRRQRAEYLKAFPQLAQELGQAREGVEGVWRQTEEHWFDILDDIGTRSIAIEAARQAKDYDLTDQLYLINDLDYDQLGEDTAVHYFDETSDFNTLPKDVLGPRSLRSGPFGQDLLSRVKVLPDFDKWRFDRMNMEEKAKFKRDTEYINGLKDIIAKAKASKNFGATFVRLLKKDPKLLAEYFRRNKGKREKWAANDEYIGLISRYGLLAKAGKFAQAGRYFDSLPNWVKERYYDAHPDRRKKRADAQESFQYMGFMEKWTGFYRHRDYAGGAAYFAKLPQWVKDRYYAKHPQSAKFANGNTSAYAKAMGGWVKLLQDGKKEQAKAYFDALPDAYKKRYYAKHPEQKLKNDIHRVGQLGEYFAADDANRALYLRDNPEFAKWLRSQSSNEQTRRMMILAAYNGLPKEDQWLRRVFREKYPEIFSQEAKGEQSLRKTYNFLVDHPDMLPGFEKWVEAVWASYGENLKHSGTRPKPVLSDHSRQRSHGLDRVTPHHGRSAAWVRLHSIS